MTYSQKAQATIVTLGLGAPEKSLEQVNLLYIMKTPMTPRSNLLVCFYISFKQTIPSEIKSLFFSQSQLYGITMYGGLEWSSVCVRASLDVL